MSGFTLLTLNIHQGMSAWARRPVIDRLRTAVQALQADVLCLQEVRGAAHAASPVSLSSDTAPDYEAIADRMWPQFAYGRNAVFPRGHMGNAVLSKFPIIDHRNHDVSIAPGEKRGMLWCQLTHPETGQRVHVVSVHLAVRGAHRRMQLQALCALVQAQMHECDEPLLVAGDFNDWRGQADTILARCGLRNANATENGRLPRTFPAQLPCLALDRIYTRNLVVEEARVLGGRPWSHLSDHLPLMARVRVA